MNGITKIVIPLNLFFSNVYAKTAKRSQAIFWGLILTKLIIALARATAITFRYFLSTNLDPIKTVSKPTILKKVVSPNHPEMSYMWEIKTLANHSWSTNGKLDIV